MSQLETPLFDALLKHRNRHPIQFHIPGHKKGQGMDPAFREFVGDNVLSIDLINIAPLDDLHSPKAAIKEAQELAAQAFGADYTFFSVQGTSGAIMAMIMSVVGPGDKILVPRNVHKSTMSAIILSGAIPIFIYPEVDEEFGITHGISAESVEKAIETYPDAKAVLVINPTYFGFAADLKRIVDIAHTSNIPVIVDEAHGIHLKFHDELPISAMEAGADMAATSVHKLGGSLTQSSVLNVREGLVSVSRVQSVLSMLQTTSTSYPLLASLDCARRQLAVHGYDLIDQAIRLAKEARKRINKIPHLKVAGREKLHSSATFDMDQTKLLISVKDLGITGHQAEEWLRQNANIEVELSDLYNILCLVTLGDTKKEINLLINALQRMSQTFDSEACVKETEVNVPDIPALAMTPRDAFYSSTEVIPFKDSAGYICAEFIMVYPPGIPIFIPGEVITEENIKYIQMNIEAGLPVQGPEDASLQTIRVIKERKPIY
ncbi:MULTISPECIES: aminotransferase class I/II-fold pyridoxal phosphate-dependent enzyme [Ureibacillus]|uniref:Lysine decarboxylase n=1 Tax=Ureibacillus thermosphaericus TaxID=51173 RepID=A0A840PTR8_URETH|nr:aminotransferase class I/II-fold pyridoxal phosphate-dependent enzyme [Ureibacillus thermosphaericus]MBB5149287.1 lysine decarboxylase [Ureibacillus thermosphaericus]NKZ32132.1 aminotransferase class I/II-fold pyridoxal phosphate-dependent enzyme [Ureibacillus thermosphaericus]